MQYSVVNYKTVKENSDFRIDGEYYHPDFLLLESRMNELNSQTFGSLVREVRCGPFGSTVLCDTYLENGVIVARPFNLINYSLERENLVFIEEKDCKEKKLKFYKEGDIFFSRVGDVRCGVVPEFENKVTISPNIIAVKVDVSKIDPYYATIFFNSKYGFPQITRGLKVVAQPTIQTDLISKLKIILLSNNFQQIIAKLFRQSLNLQDQSKSLYYQASQLLLSELGLLDWKPKHELSFIKTFSEAQKAERFDAEYFQPKYEKIIEAVKKYKGGFDVIKGQFKSNKKSFKKIADKEYRYIEIGCVNISDGSMESIALQGSELPANAKIKFQKNDVLVSKVRPYRGAIGIIDCDDYVGSGAFTVLQENGVVNKETLMVFLRLKPLLDFSLKFNTGTSYPTIIDEDILNFPLPKIDFKTQEQIKEKITEMYETKKSSKFLLDLAKRGVEMAIEKSEDEATEWLNNQISNK